MHPVNGHHVARLRYEAMIADAAREQGVRSAIAPRASAPPFPEARRRLTAILARPDARDRGGPQPPNADHALNLLGPRVPIA